MDAGPGTDLGALGWFLGVWVVMMAAMMFPSLAPTVALYKQMARGRGWDRPLLFASGYLFVWGAAGLLAYGVFRAGRALFGSDLAWHAGGRWVAGGVIAAAALYELTPMKDICLTKCRTPVGFLIGNWRDGRLGAIEMGSKHAAWCLGCCCALMAALFALGVMSITWMAIVAGVIALEKILPWRRVATWGTAALLLALAVGLVAWPHDVPGLVVPGESHMSMHPPMHCSGGSQQERASLRRTPGYAGIGHHRRVGRHRRPARGGADRARRRRRRDGERDGAPLSHAPRGGRDRSSRGRCTRRGESSDRGARRRECARDRR
jgi:predicted metal-binding membrane protein